MLLKLSDIASHVDGKIEGSTEIEISGVAKIEEANAGEITFIANTKYIKFLRDTKASAVIVPDDMEESAGGKALIRTHNPYFAFLKTIELFYPPGPLLEKGIHETVVIGEKTKLGDDLALGPYVVIGKRCRIGSGCILMPGVVLGDDVVIGQNCTLHAHVCLRERVVIGNRVVIHNGAVIGSDGFGFAPEEGKYYKIPQVGTVVIEDDVEIGANAAIDRATLGETRIRKGAKLDNLIQIGHNCTVGEDTVIAAQTGLSGSTHLGKGVRVGGQVGFAGHLEVGEGAAVGAKSGVDKSIPGGSYVFGIPARPYMEEFRIQGAIHRLPERLKEIRELKKEIEQLKKEMRERC
jgi:UDP-3-O-[3-hydroxymyristoyl] glucosamine N-acyltransferase